MRLLEKHRRRKCLIAITIIWAVLKMFLKGSVANECRDGVEQNDYI